MPTCYLVDGTALAYRNHFAFIQNPLVNTKGQETSATFGYTNALRKLLKEDRPDYIAVAFDLPEPTFRKKRYPAYKATREKAPQEMVAQLPWIKQVTGALGVPVLELAGWEADDVIGTLAKRAEAEGLEVRIVSGDKDMMQLVSERVRMLDLGKRGGPELIGPEEVEAKFGVEPGRVVDVLGLMGDSSDNVPGVPLVGPKKAAQLVQEHGSLPAVLDAAPSMKKSKTQGNLVEFAEQARLSLDLVTLDLEAPIDVDLDALRAGEPDPEALAELFVDLEFTALAQEYAGGESAAPADASAHVIAVDAAEARRVADTLRDRAFFVVETETAGSDAFADDLVGVAVAWDEGRAAYLPWSDDVRALLQPLLEDASIGKGAQDLKLVAHVLRTHGIDLANFDFDTMLASYLLEPGRGGHTLESLALRHLGLKKTSKEEVVGKGKKQLTMAEVDVEAVGAYAAEDADCAFRLAAAFRPRLEEAGVMELFRDVEMPLVPVLFAMERRGVRVDTDYLAGMSRELEETEQGLVGEIHELAGEEFNVQSPKQLGPILFERLEIQKDADGPKRIKRTKKTGAYATDAQSLEAYAAHPIVAKLLEYREVAKLRSTYVDALPQMVRKDTGRIHSSFNQAVAATGRLSSADPNLQNIPVRTELGRRIRRAFVADDGWRLVSADYSQIELRLMAHLSGDPALTEVYEQGGDVHTETAARMFGLDADAVTRDQRGSAKAINFGILYGMGAQRLARDLKIPFAEAKRFLEAYFREFPGVRDFQKQAVELARSQGYVTTLLGRRRTIPDIASKDPGRRAQAENMAKNTPVQGTAADLIKIAMIRIHERLIAGGFEAEMILQVHDELVFEAPAGEVEKLSKMVRAEMEGALELDVPIVADVGVGANWLEAH